MPIKSFQHASFLAWLFSIIFFYKNLTHISNRKAKLIESCVLWNGRGGGVLIYFQSWLKAYFNYEVKLYTFWLQKEFYT